MDTLVLKDWAKPVMLLGCKYLQESPNGQKFCKNSHNSQMGLAQKDRNTKMTLHKSQNHISTKPTNKGEKSVNLLG